MIQLLNTFRNLMVKCLNLHTNTAQTNSLSVKTIYESKSYFWQYKKKAVFEIGLWFGSRCVRSRPTAAQSKEFSERP